MSSTARLVITAVVHQDRPVAEVAATYGVHRSWVYRLVRRYEKDGEAALEPRSRRPKTVPRATSTDTVAAILDLRQQLTAAGHDAGPATIAEHLTRSGVTVSVATIWRTLNRHDLITPEPKKRPKASYIRFEASAPNECWQSDFTHVRLAGGTDTEVITGPTVTTTFQATAAEHGLPATVLTDNGLVYTTRPLRARNAFQRLLHKHSIHQKNGAPNHPQTQGKVERFQQPLKKHLATRAPADSIAELQAQIDAFVTYYNTTRPHRSLGGRTPRAAYIAKPKAVPIGSPAGKDNRVRHDKVDGQGSVTLRYNGRLHHIGVGRTHARTPVVIVIQDRHIVIAAKDTGEIIRELTLDPTRDYQPRTTTKPEPSK